MVRLVDVDFRGTHDGVGDGEFDGRPSLSGVAVAGARHRRLSNDAGASSVVSPALGV